MDKVATKEALEMATQALNDKIAQQDYIRIEVASLDSSQHEFTSEEKALIRKHLSNWPDIILVEKGLPYQVRIVAADARTIAWYDMNSLSIVLSDIGE